MSVCEFCTRFISVPQFGRLLTSKQTFEYVVGLVYMSRFSLAIGLTAFVLYIHHVNTKLTPHTKCIIN